MTIRAVIYDLDGTLVDSERLWHEAETSLLAVRGLRYYDEVRVALLGQRMDACIRIIRDHYSLSDSVTKLRSELLERMMALVERKLQKRPGAEELLARVKEIGLPAAIASSSPLSFIEGVVRSCGWDELYFPASQNYLFSADDVPNGKPAPDVYLAAAKSLGIPPMECLAIEDSPTGARAAVAAGMTCIAVWDSFHSKVDDFTDITPHCYANLKECWSKIRDWAAR